MRLPESSTPRERSWTGRLLKGTGLRAFPMRRPWGVPEPSRAPARSHPRLPRRPLTNSFL